jgi:hypothetical protein
MEGAIGVADRPAGAGAERSWEWVRTMAERVERSWSSRSGGPAFVGVLFIGLAIGIVTGQVAGFVMAGLGVAFLAMALLGGVRSRSGGGLLFVGSLMTGIGVGLLLGNAAVGVLLGLGVGFLLMALAQRAARD